MRESGSFLKQDGVLRPTVTRGVESVLPWCFWGYNYSIAMVLTLTVTILHGWGVGFLTHLGLAWTQSKSSLSASAL